MLRLFLIIVVSLLLASCGGMDPEEVSRKLTHRFEGDGVAVQLKQGAGTTWTGTLSRAGLSMPVTATLEGTSLTGQFTHDGSSFAFTAKLKGDTLTIDSGGQKMTLKDTAVNPLADAGTPPVNPLVGQPDAAVSTPPVSNPLAGGNPPTTNPLAGGSPPAPNPLAGGSPPASNPLAGGGSTTTNPPSGGTSGPATAIQADAVYDGPKRLESPTTGASFDLPANWQAQAPSGVPMMVLAPKDNSLFGLAMCQSPISPSELQQLLADPIDLGQGAVLQVMGLTINGNQIQAQVNGRGGDGRQLIGGIQGRINADSAILFLVVGAADARAQVDAGLSALVQSVRLTAPRRGQLASNEAQARQMLSGTRLEISSSDTFDGGFTRSYERWDFCGSGEYQYSQGGNTSVSVDIPDYDTGGSPGNVSATNNGDSDRELGRWTLQAVGTITGEVFMLTLQSQQGTTSMDVIAEAQQGVFFRGQVWSAETSPLCQ